MTRPVLARLELPEQTLLLYEQMGLKDLDRSANWRFLIRSDGCFFVARNTQLWLDSAVLLQSDDPALFWNSPFASTPNRCLTAPQRAALLEALHSANLPVLQDHYTADPNARISSPVAERWTVVLDGQTSTVVVENRAAPPQLVTLRSAVDALVAAAPRP